jgi:two-component system, NarL family, nitrate/nitrite response regulator NarL
VLLADDHLRVLDSAVKLVGSSYRIVATVSDGLTAVEVAKELSPDLIVLDIEMPGMDGIRAAQEMRRMGLQAKIIFLTVHKDEDYIAAARASGNGYVLKSRMGSDLRLAINEAFSGRFFVSRRVLEEG